MYRLAKLLLALSLAACGAPGAESFFDPDSANSAPSNPPAVPVAEQTAAPDIRTYRGYYRQFEEQTRFQPCGTNTLLDMESSFETMVLLKERYRWLSAYQGVKLYAVFRGSIVTDTPAVGANTDSAKRVARTRFLLVGFDSVRVWQVNDCNGMKIAPLRPGT